MQRGHLEAQQGARLDEIVDTRGETESLVHVARRKACKGGFSGDTGDHDSLTFVDAVDDGAPENIT